LVLKIFSPALGLPGGASENDAIAAAASTQRERDLEGADGEEEANYNFWFALWTCAEIARTRFFL
jgi:hypothetical protein